MRIVAVREIVSCEGVDERCIHSFRRENVQELAEIRRLLGLIACVVAPEGNRPANLIDFSGSVKCLERVQDTSTLYVSNQVRSSKGLAPVVSCLAPVVSCLAPVVSCLAPVVS